MPIQAFQQKGYVLPQKAKSNQKQKWSIETCITKFSFPQFRRRNTQRRQQNRQLTLLELITAQAPRCTSCPNAWIFSKAADALQLSESKMRERPVSKRHESWYCAEASFSCGLLSISLKFLGNATYLKNSRWIPVGVLFFCSIDCEQQYKGSAF